MFYTSKIQLNYKFIQAIIRDISQIEKENIAMDNNIESNKACEIKVLISCVKIFD